MAKKKLRDADQIKGMEGIAASLAIHGSEVPQLETATGALGTVLSRVHELAAQRASHQADKQRVSQELRALIDEGTRLVTVIRVTLKQHFGNRSEELVKFGLQPFRGLTRKKKSPAPENPTTPEELTVKPAVTPASTSTE